MCVCVCVCVYNYWVVCQWSRRPGFNTRSSHTKDSKNWYLMMPCLALSIIKWGSKVKWSNPGNEVAPFSIPRCSSFWKRSLWVTLDYGRQLCLYIYMCVCVCVCIYIYIYVCVCVCVCVYIYMHIYIYIYIYAHIYKGSVISFQHV